MEIGSAHARLHGVAYEVSMQMKEAGCKAEIRETILGHIQRGGTPIAFDRILATLFGVKAFEMVMNGEYGRMVTYKNNDISTASLTDAVKAYNYVDTNGTLVNAARGIGISFGD